MELGPTYMKLPMMVAMALAEHYLS